MDFEDFLIEVFNDFIKKHNLPEVSADQILYESAYETEYQRQWLQNFIATWESHIDYQS